MVDVLIFDRSSDIRRSLFGICEHYFIENNMENHILYCGNDAKKMMSVIDGSTNLYLMEASDELRSVSGFVRKSNYSSYIVVSVNDINELAKCINPSVMPAGVLFRPPERADVERILDEVEYDLKTSAEQNSRQVFTVKIKSKEYLVEMDKIILFEAREKKIFVRTICQELSYYDTLADIEKKLSKEFIRVHKSFLVNKNHISEINRQQNSLIMDDGSVVYYSRTYKSAVDDIGKNETH